MKRTIRNLLLLCLLAALTALIVGYYFFSSTRVEKIQEGMVFISGGEFLMGSQSKLAKENEKPVHRVTVASFWMDQTDVTNDQFANFVKATGYVTTAERKPDWETIKVQLPAGTLKPSEKNFIPGAMVFIGTQTPVSLNDPYRWWTYVPGANWQHPQGPHSDIKGKGSHPVVQVSYEDAQAYAKWLGKRLPTEAEWEYAARGGLKEADYAWGKEFKPQGKSMAKIFAGKHFPVLEPGDDIQVSTAPVRSYPPNSYGLYDMAGNVWQWVADWYRSDAYLVAGQEQLAQNPQGPQDSYDPADHFSPSHAPKRVIRGGSFLCDPEFCMSYRPSARRGSDPYNPMAHIGFRLVRSA